MAIVVPKYQFVEIPLAKEIPSKGMKVKEVEIDEEKDKGYDDHDEGDDADSYMTGYKRYDEEEKPDDSGRNIIGTSNPWLQHQSLQYDPQSAPRG